MSKKPQLRNTTNYGMFRRNDANRPVDPRHLKKLRQSMALYGWIPAFPMMVRSDATGRVILDGEHRFTIAQELDLTVWYVEVSGDYNVPKINEGAVHWSSVDYGTSYAEQNVRDYAEVIAFASEYSMPITDAAAILGGTCTFGNVSKSWKEGTYTIRDRAYARKVAYVYDALRNIKREAADKSLRLALMAACRVQDFDADRMIRKARQYPDGLQKFATRDAALTMIETIYNRGRGAAVPLRINALAAMAERDPATAGKARKVS